MKLRFDIKSLARETWHKLHQLRDAPHAIAGGVAVGIFWGFTPLTGLKTLLSIFFAWVFRCSKIPAVIAVTFHDVLLPVWPVILLWEYKIGFWLLSHPHRLPPKLAVSKVHFAQLFQWKTLELLWPTFLGSCVIGLPIALFFYWIVERSLERSEKRHHQITPPA
jgi:uncharacterized protein (DUF2062 family)